MVKIGFKIERGGGGKPILNEFNIAKFTKTLDLFPKIRIHNMIHNMYKKNKMYNYSIVSRHLGM